LFDESFINICSYLREETVRSMATDTAIKSNLGQCFSSFFTSKTLSQTEIFPGTTSLSFLLTYLLRGDTVLAELWPPHTFCLRFRDSKFLQGGVVSTTPNPQPGAPGYLSYSGTSIETCPAWVALPAAMLPPV
jgi:hypothetical protein